MRTGLVLEGGAMRGLFSAGVIDVMMEQGIDFDGLIGVSAGSSFGCNFKSRQPGRVIRYNLRFHNDPRYMGLRSLLTTGDLVGAEFAYHTLPLELDIFDSETFENNPMEFHLVCTDVITGQPPWPTGLLPHGACGLRLARMAPGLSLNAHSHPPRQSQRRSPSP